MIEEEIGLEPRPPLLLPLLLTLGSSQQKKERREIRVGESLRTKRQQVDKDPTKKK